MPVNLKQSPADSGNKFYDLGIPAETLTDGSFVLRMIPVAGGTMESDQCGSFTLTSTGVRGVLVNDVAGETAVRDSCWR